MALSMATKLNVGVAAMAFAWLIGVFGAGWKAEEVAAGFPSSLFLTLTGVTLLFALAETNGTLDRLAHRALALARGQARLLPVLLFLIACALSSVGPGAITFTLMPSGPKSWAAVRVSPMTACLLAW